MENGNIYSVNPSFERSQHAFPFSRHWSPDSLVNLLQKRRWLRWLQPITNAFYIHHCEMFIIQTIQWLSKTIQWLLRDCPFFVHQMQEGKYSLASLEISMPGCLDIQMSDTVFSVSFGFSFAQQIDARVDRFIRNGFRTWSHVVMSNVFFSDHGRSLAHIHIIYRWYIIKSSCSFCHHYCCRQSLLVIFYLSNYTLGQMGHICKPVTLTQVSQKSFFTESGFYQYEILVFVEAGPSFISNLGSENGITTPMSWKRQLAI